MTETFSLEEAGRRICGDSIKDPALWVRRKIRAGTFKAFKAGRTVRMTERHIEDAITALEIGRADPQQRRLGITTASMRRRSA